MELTIQLTDEQLGQLVAELAPRVAEILADRPGAGGLVDAAAVAVALGVKPATVRAHAADLGGVQVGDGERPRWRFDLDQALAAWRSPPAAGAPATRAPRRRRSTNGAGLLPVHENGRHA